MTNISFGINRSSSTGAWLLILSSALTGAKGCQLRFMSQKKRRNLYTFLKQMVKLVKYHMTMTMNTKYNTSGEQTRHFTSKMRSPVDMISSLSGELLLYLIKSRTSKAAANSSRSLARASSEHQKTHPQSTEQGWGGWGSWLYTPQGWGWGKCIDLHYHSEQKCPSPFISPQRYCFEKKQSDTILRTLIDWSIDIRMTVLWQLNTIQINWHKGKIFYTLLRSLLHTDDDDDDHHH